MLTSEPVEGEAYRSPAEPEGIRKFHLHPEACSSMAWRRLRIVVRRLEDGRADGGPDAVAGTALERDPTLRELAAVRDAGPDRGPAVGPARSQARRVRHAGPRFRPERHASREA